MDSQITKVTAHISHNEALIFERSQPGRAGFSLPALDVPETAIDEIARWTKKTRDATFIDKDKDGYTVNRLETIGWIGGCTDTNELNFLAVKTMRSMGLCYFETQARV